MKTNNVCIIGAGMAGSYAAYLAAQAGYPVEILEKIPKKEFRSSPLRGRKCGEGIWQSKLNAAGIDISTEPFPWVENVATSILFGVVDRSELVRESVRGAMDPYVLINRQLFADFYLGKALEHGATLHCGIQYPAIEERLTDAENGMVLCAFGTNNRLIKKLIRREEGGKFVSAFQRTYQGVNTEKLENAKCIFLSDDPDVQYFWIFPKERGTSCEANVGVMFSRSGIRYQGKYLDGFVQAVHEYFERAEVDESRTYSKPISVSSPLSLQDMVADHLIPLGDTGGFCSAVSGGGIGYALLSARMAVESLEDPSPQGAFFEKMAPTSKKLEEDVRLASILFPSNPEAAAAINRKYLDRVKTALLHGGILSLSNIGRSFLSGS